MRFLKRSSRSHRKAKSSRRLTPRQLFLRSPRHANYGPLPELPSGSMPQRSTPPRTVHSRIPTDVELAEAAQRLTGSFRGHFRLNGDAPLFRGDDMTWAQFDEQRMERLRLAQDLANPWPDRHGVNLGEHHGPKTLVYATTLYERFTDNTATIPAVKR